MIAEEDIARACSMRTFQRARQIADKSNNFLTKQCRYAGDDTVLTAFVAASSGWSDRYRVSTTIDERADEIVDYSCTCPDFLKLDEMCKHTAALGLTYIDDPTGFLGYKEHRTAETSPSIIAYMHRAERVAAQDDPRTIAIEPVLTYGFENWSVHFSLNGPKGSYAMKDVVAFADAVKNEERVTYGKKLAFTHTDAAFDDRSRKIAAFIERACARRERAIDPAHHARRAGRGARRDLDLSEGEVIELIEIMGTDLIEFNCTDATTRSRMRIHVVSGDPDLTLRIVRDEDGGYLIPRDEGLVFAAEGERMYLLQDDMLFRCSSRFARCAEFLRDVYRSNDDKLYIARDDMPLFCATALPLLESALSVDVPPEVDLMRPVDAKFSFYFDKRGGVIEVSVRAAYGSESFVLAGPPRDEIAEDAPIPPEAEGLRGDRPAPLRDDVLEQRMLRLVREFFDESCELPLSDEEAAGALLFGGLARFRAVGDVYTTPAFDRLVSDKKPRVQIGLSLAGNLIDLDVSATDLSPEELAGLLGSYRRRRRYHRLNTGAFLDIAEYDLSELEKLVDDLGISSRDLASGSIEIPTYRAFYLDREFSEARRDEAFDSYAKRFRAIDQTAYNVPAALEGVLRPYQREGFQWMSALCDMGFCGVLADEMGLGKSLQLISVLVARIDEVQAEGGALIICPASLVYNWVAEFASFAPDIDVMPVEGTRAERMRARREKPHDVLITSYDMARADIEDLQEKRFAFCVLDEAQYIKNHATLTTRAVKRINAAHRFALTGTPMENRLSEIWSIFDFLMPGFLGSYARFRERFELGIVGGDEDLARRLNSLIGPFVLRRSKESVLPELPEKLDSVVYVPLTGEQRALYDANEQRLREDLNKQKINSSKRTPDPVLAKSRIEVLAELTRLRQIALDPSLVYDNYRGNAAKLGAICDLIGQAMDAGHKTLVFSQFTSYLAHIAEALDGIGVPYYTITGATPKKARIDAVNAFNTDDVPVFLISLKAGGTGLNLTGASVVIHADPWWNAAATDQATDRAHRIGQRNLVSVYKIIAKGTIEERILELQEAKSKLADSVVGKASGMSLASLTQDALIDLLSS